MWRRTDTDSLSEFYAVLSTEQKDGIESVCMDMWPAYIKATRDALTDADRKIAFDRFHVAQYLGKAVDQVRRQEHRQLIKQGDERMKGSKYHWLRNRSNMSWHQQRNFSAIAAIVTEDGACVGDQRVRFTIVGIPQQDLGIQGLEAPDQLDGPQSSQADAADRQNLAQAPVGHSQCGDTGREQQPCREHELAHQNSEDPCQRVQKQTAVPECDLLPSGWFTTLSG